MIHYLKTVDRRIIFVLMALFVAFPLLHPLNMPVTPSVPVIDQYQFIENLKPGDTVLMSFDFGPSTAIEVEPAGLAMLRQCFRKGVRVIGLTLLPDGLPFLSNDMKQIGEECHKVYGVDYVNLGFMAGGFVVVKNIGNGFATAFPTDYYETPTGTLPLMQTVHGYRDVAVVLSLSSADPGIKDWLKIVTSEYKRPMGGACTAVWFPELSPYLDSHQLVGLVGGLRGGAEYEKLMSTKGLATAGMDAQSIAHVGLVCFIVISNVVYFVDRRRTRL